MNISSCLGLSALLLLTSCSEAPKCTYSGASTFEANAGCFVMNKGKVLIIEDRRGYFQLPGGGKNTGEIAQCTAERETWEETGAVVKVKTSVKTFENGFMLFECDVIGEQDFTSKKRPWTAETKAVHWLGPQDFGNKKWRFPKQAAFIKTLLERKLQNE